MDGCGMGGSPNPPLSYTDLWRASPMTAAGGYMKPPSSPPLPPPPPQQQQPLSGDPSPLSSASPSAGGTNISSAGTVATSSRAAASSFAPASAAPVDYLNTSAAFPPPVPPLELDPLAGVFSFSPCGPTYKELSASFKGEKGHDIAEALLSLKHTVVGPLSPHFGATQSGTSGMPPGSSLTYPSSHQPQMSAHSAHHQPPYSPISSGQYHHGPSSHQYNEAGSASHNSPGVHQSQHGGMFPSMSVNVQMSMNVGMPPVMGSAAQCGGAAAQDAHWSAMGHQPSSATASGQYSPSASAGAQNLHSQTQYPGPSYHYHHSGQTHHTNYHASYSFSSDLRQPAASYKDMMYPRSAAPSEQYRDVSKYYSFNASMKSTPRSPYPLKHGGISPLGSRSHANIQENGKLNLCRICGKTYARPSTLKTHLRTHSGEKPYRCTTCSKSFSQAANLTAHLRTHSGEKPFRCPMCERRFSQSSSVTTHMRTHSGERPYRCSLCKKAFSDSSTLTKHLRIHSGEKPYQCKLCLLRFSQSGNLNRHMRVHANNG